MDDRPPLSGIRIVEFAGRGPVPFACRFLHGAGADVIRIARPGQAPKAILDEGRPTLIMDLHDDRSIERAQDLISKAHVVIEGYRPGVMERLGLGPEACLQSNRSLVYARMTGWGQTGPLAAQAGHDINYLSVTGVLHHVMGASGDRAIPLNVIGDYGGGGMMLVALVCMALRDAEERGIGRVLDVAMVDGASLLLSAVWSRMATGQWSTVAGENELDGGAPYYNVYETKDHRFMAVGAMESVFFRRVLVKLNIDPDDAPNQEDQTSWPRMKRLLAERFAQRSQREWISEFNGVDACVTPVLDVREAAAHPHVRSRGDVMEVDGCLVPPPTPQNRRQVAGAWPIRQEEGIEQVLRRWQ